MCTACVVPGNIYGIYIVQCYDPVWLLCSEILQVSEEELSKGKTIPLVG